MNSNIKKGRLVLILITAFFVVPFFGAAYYHHKAQQGELWGTTNNGVLIHPAQPLMEFALLTTDAKEFSLDDMRGEWTMLYVFGSKCDQACKQTIFNMRQIRALLHKDAHRLRRLLLSDTAASGELSGFLLNYPKMLVAVDKDKELIGQLPKDILKNEPAVYLVDPIGNVMMAFPQSLDATKVLKDIKKLLRISQIG